MNSLCPCGKMFTAAKRFNEHFSVADWNLLPEKALVYCWKHDKFEEQSRVFEGAYRCPTSESVNEVNPHENPKEYGLWKWKKSR